MAVVTDLDAVHRDVTRIMLRHYGDRLAKIVLYGSYARGDFHEESDVDYIVALEDEEVSSSKELKKYSNDVYGLFLDKYVQVSAFAIPVITLNSSNKAIYQTIRREGKPVYERSDTRLY